MDYELCYCVYVSNVSSPVNFVSPQSTNSKSFSNAAAAATMSSLKSKSMHHYPNASTTTTNVCNYPSNLNSTQRRAKSHDIIDPGAQIASKSSTISPKIAPNTNNNNTNNTNISRLHLTRQHRNNSNSQSPPSLIYNANNTNLPPMHSFDPNTTNHSHLKHKHSNKARNPSRFLGGKVTKTSKTSNLRRIGTNTSTSSIHNSSSHSNIDNSDNNDLDSKPTPTPIPEPNEAAAATTTEVAASKSTKPARKRSVSSPLRNNIDMASNPSGKAINVTSNSPKIITAKTPPETKINNIDFNAQQQKQNVNYLKQMKLNSSITRDEKILNAAKIEADNENKMYHQSNKLLLHTMRATMNSSNIDDKASVCGSSSASQKSHSHSHLKSPNILLHTSSYHHANKHSGIFHNKRHHHNMSHSHSFNSNQRVNVNINTNIKNSSNSNQLNSINNNDSNSNNNIDNNSNSMNQSNVNTNDFLYDMDLSLLHYHRKLRRIETRNIEKQRAKEIMMQNRQLLLKRKRKPTQRSSKPIKSTTKSRDGSHRSKEGYKSPRDDSNIEFKLSQQQQQQNKRRSRENTPHPKHRSTDKSDENVAAAAAAATNISNEATISNTSEGTENKENKHSKNRQKEGYHSKRHGSSSSKHKHHHRRRDGSKRHTNSTKIGESDANDKINYKEQQTNVFNSLEISNLFWEDFIMTRSKCKLEVQKAQVMKKIQVVTNASGGNSSNINNNIGASGASSPKEMIIAGAKDTDRLRLRKKKFLNKTNENKTDQKGNNANADELNTNQAISVSPKSQTAEGKKRMTSNASKGEKETKTSEKDETNSIQSKALKGKSMPKETTNSSNQTTGKLLRRAKTEVNQTGETTRTNVFDDNGNRNASCINCMLYIYVVVFCFIFFFLRFLVIFVFCS